MYNCHLDTQPGDLGPLKGCYLVTSTERSFNFPLGVRRGLKHHNILLTKAVASSSLNGLESIEE